MDRQITAEDQALKAIETARDASAAYAEIQRICELTESCDFEDYSQRDVNYPLGIVWQGRGNGGVERPPC